MATILQVNASWFVDLDLPPELVQCVKDAGRSSLCQVLSWQEAQVQRLRAILFGSSKVAVKVSKAMIEAGKLKYIFIARHLHLGGRPHDGVAYEFQHKSDPICVRLSDPRWIGLDESLFIDQLRDNDLQTPLLDARLMEEIAHIWDYQLEADGSPYCSAGAEWKKVECSRGAPKPFYISNRKDYDLVAEDWASALVWYVFQPDDLKRISPERYCFAERLLSMEGFL